MQKTFDPKWLTTLKSNEEISKRYKAFLSIKKYAKDSGDSAKYKEVLDQLCSPIFQIITDKMMKLTTGWEMMNIFGPTSPKDVSTELIEALNDLFCNLDKKAITELRSQYKIRLVALLKILIEPHTKREARFNGFKFLIRILDSYDDPSKADFEYKCLFKLAFNPRESQLHYTFQLNNESQIGTHSKEYSEYNLFLTNLVDLTKTLSASDSSPSKGDDLKEIFLTVLGYSYTEGSNIQAWYKFLMNTWLYLYFNEKKEEKEEKQGIFIESWRTGFVSNPTLSQYLPKYVETVLKDPNIVLTLEELFSLMSKIEYLYWNINITNEIKDILKIYSDFIGKKFKFNTDFDYEKQIFKKIIGTLNELFQRYLWKANKLFSKTDLNTPEDRICIDICYELISLYKASYGNEIFSSVMIALEKSESSSYENEDFIQRSYSLIEVVIVVSTLSSLEDRDKYMDGLKHYLEIPQIAGKFIEFHRKKIREFIILISNDVKPEWLKGLEIVQGSEIYSMKVEYLPQLFLQEFCRESKQNIEIDHEYFENNTKKLNHLTIRAKKGNDMNEILSTLSNLRTKFEEWLKILIIIYNTQLHRKNPNFIQYCQGFRDTIIDLVNPENAIVQTDKTKSPVQAKYPMATETLYQLFDNFFTKTIREKDEINLEGFVYSMEGYLEIFTNTQSELPCSKEIIKEVFIFIINVLQKNSEQNTDYFLQKCFLIKFCKSLFLQDIAGTKVLIPLFLKFIGELVIEGKFSNFDKETRTVLEKIIKIPINQHEDYLKHYRVFLIAAMKIIKSVAFFAYTDNITPLQVIDKACSHIKSTRDIRTCILDLIQFFMEDVKKSRGSSLAFMASPYYDNEVLYSFFTIALLIMGCECDPRTPTLTEPKYSSELYVNSFLELLVIDFRELPKNSITLFTHLLENLAFLIGHRMNHYKTIFKKSITNLLSAIKKLLAIGNGTYSTTKDTAGEFFYVLSRFILNDRSFLLYKDEKLLEDLNDIISSISKIPDYKEFSDTFFTHFMLYYANFPLKNLNIDSKSSIFEESSFRILPHDYSKHLEVKKMTQSNSSRDDESDSDDALRPINKSQSTREYRNSNDFALSKDYGHNSQRHKHFLANFQYLKLTDTFWKRLPLFKDPELVDHLNMLINKYNADSQDHNTVYFSYKDGTILSHVGKGASNTSSRMICRNPTGKFAWEFTYLKALNQNVLHTDPKSLASILHTRLKIKIKDFFEKDRFEKKSDQNDSDEAYERTDLLNTFYETINIMIPDTKSSYLEVDKSDEEGRTRRLKKNQQFEDKYEKAKDFDAQRQSRKQRSSDSEMLRKKDLLELTNHTKHIDLTTHCINMSSKDATRLLLSNLNFINLFKNDKQGPDIGVFESDKSGQELNTTLNLLDNSSARENIKIGVIYVARGQDNQRDILKNEEGSERYDRFISRLGEKITLKNHLGFQAGLDYQRDGDKAIYSGDVLTEVMFHVVTLMPTDEHDDQSVNKKKHVGNDSVNIVWCENYRTYRKNTVSSSFNTIQIIIYPLKNRLCRVQIHKKENVGIFFPDLDNVLICEDYLPIYVKLCAMNGVRDSRIHREQSRTTEAIKTTQKRSEYIRNLNEQKSTNVVKKKTEIKDIVLSLLGDHPSN